MRGLRRLRLLVAGCSAVAVAGAGVGAASPAASAQTPGASRAAHDNGSCQLGDGVKHVIEITFDNVHFFRDNPNVPSDLEQMPTLLHFLEANGTVLSNMHTPLIAHTAEDSLAIYTGLYGDRHGMPVSNSYKSYHPDGTTEPDGSFVYWTSPVYNTATAAPSTTDTSPSMVYSDPANPSANGSITPAPWVPFTRAGCSVGDFSTANMVLENAPVDIPSVFGANSPEAAQLAADSANAPFWDSEIADYIGVAVHCAKGATICSDAKAVKFGQTAPTASAAADKLPSEPGGYDGYQALFGAKYVAPQIGAGTPNETSHGYPVTDASGNLTDLNGNTIKESFANKPGFPGFNPTATQSLAYVADMQEAGIPVTYAYISDIHDKKPGQTGCTSNSLGALGPGDPCMESNAAEYDQAFAKFLDRLAKDGITPKNTEFVVSAEENDHFAGANAGRASTPSCTGTTCSYAAGQIGELEANLPDLLKTQTGDMTPFAVEPQGAVMYVTGTASRPQPGADNPSVRQLERDTAALTADNPYSGAKNEKIVNYQADAVEQQILHMQTADPLRTPTYTIFPKPDYYFCQSASLSTCPAGVTVYSKFAWNHGYYSPDIDITWAAFVGPNVRDGGVDGRAANNGPAVVDPNATKTVPELSTQGTWADETDIRPTLLSLVGLRDDYRGDGRVITQILRQVPRRLAGTTDLGNAFKQLDASVGQFGTDTLIADTAALASGSATNDHQFTEIERALAGLGAARTALATKISQTLWSAEFDDRAPSRTTISSELAGARALLAIAEQLRMHVGQ
ncbi:MAG: hypothetical protein ACRDV3_00380 [Acidothermaceae bacterium]